MKKSVLGLSVALMFLPVIASAANSSILFNKEWTTTHSILSEISAFDASTNSIWVAGVTGVDILDLATGAKTGFIDISPFGSINSVAIKNGVAAFAIENHTRTDNGFVHFYNTTSQSLIRQVSVGALPDMVTFTPDGSKLLVANEGTPTTYGTRIGTTTPRNYAPAAVDPAGSVSIINTNTFNVTTAGFAGVPTSGSHIRTNTGMDFEPEYIAVNAAGTKAYVTLQEANAMGVLDLNTNTFEKVVGLGAKDFSAAGNTIDPLNNGTVDFISVNAKGLYMPDGIASYQSGGNTYLVMANEGDFREDDADRSTAGSLGAVSPLNNLRISNTDSSVNDLYAAGARSFSIRDENGNIVFDSGDQLDKMAAQLGIYDDGRSRDKGVEPEGVTLLDFNGKNYAFIGLERTTTGAIAVYDITDPANASFLDMLVTEGDVSPEGIQIFESNGHQFLSIANEVSKTTTLYSLNAVAAVPEPETYAMFLLGLMLLGVSTRRNRR
jgi:DNA-binding beta-propeller fold protein YncE